MKSYAQGVRTYILLMFPGLDLVVEINPKGKQKDHIQCQCTGPGPCVHQKALTWLLENDNWIEPYEYAIRKLHRAPINKEPVQLSMFGR